MEVVKVERGSRRQMVVMRVEGSGKLCGKHCS